MPTTPSFQVRAVCCALRFPLSFPVLPVVGQAKSAFALCPGTYVVSRGGTMPCKVTVVEGAGLSSQRIIGCECLDWYQHRVICRHMLFVGSQFLSKRGVTPLSRGYGGYASEVRHRGCVLSLGVPCRIVSHLTTHFCCGHVHS